MHMCFPQALHSRLFPLLLAVLAAADTAHAQNPLAGHAERGKGEGMEAFDEVDPYTLGERDRMALLGYVNSGNILWTPGALANDVQENIGGMPILWVETAHFKIGSTLGTYKLNGGDRDEAKSIKKEVEDFKDLFGKIRIKPSKTEVDPWLRLHLYAQRVEKLYADFHAALGIDPDDYADAGPYLGQKLKFNLLLCERKSEFERYLDAYHQSEGSYMFRAYIPEGGMLFAANLEAFRFGWQRSDAPFDTVMATSILSGLVTNFVDGYRGNGFSTPTWMRFALAHHFGRKFSPRWVTGAVSKHVTFEEDGQWKWEKRVRNLVKNDFFVSTEDMFKWTDYAEMDQRDHMVAWSRLEYLLTTDGDHAAFLRALAVPIDPGATELEAVIQERQAQALLDAYGLTTQGLDQEWAAWVKKTYKSR